MENEELVPKINISEILEHLENNQELLKKIETEILNSLASLPKESLDKINKATLYTIVPDDNRVAFIFKILTK